MISQSSLAGKFARTWSTQEGKIADDGAFAAFLDGAAASFFGDGSHQCLPEGHALGFCRRRRVGLTPTFPLGNIHFRPGAPDGSGALDPVNTTCPVRRSHPESRRITVQSLLHPLEGQLPRCTAFLPIPTQFLASSDTPNPRAPHTPASISVCLFKPLIRLNKRPASKL